MASITNDVIDVLVKTGLLESNGSGGVIPGLRKVTDASGNTMLAGADGDLPVAYQKKVRSVKGKEILNFADTTFMASGASFSGAGSYLSAGRVAVQSTGTLVNNPTGWHDGTPCLEFTPNTDTAEFRFYFDGALAAGLANSPLNFNDVNGIAMEYEITDVDTSKSGFSISMEFSDDAVSLYPTNKAIFTWFRNDSTAGATYKEFKGRKYSRFRFDSTAADAKCGLFPGYGYNNDVDGNLTITDYTKPIKFIRMTCNKFSGKTLKFKRLLRGGYSTPCIIMGTDNAGPESLDGLVAPLAAKLGVALYANQYWAQLDADPVSLTRYRNLYDAGWELNGNDVVDRPLGATITDQPTMASAIQTTRARQIAEGWLEGSRVWVANNNSTSDLMIQELQAAGYVANRNGVLEGRYVFPEGGVPDAFRMPSPSCDGKFLTDIQPMIDRCKEYGATMWLYFHNVWAKAQIDADRTNNITGTAGAPIAVNASETPAAYRTRAAGLGTADGNATVTYLDNKIGASGAALAIFYEDLKEIIDYIGAQEQAGNLVTRRPSDWCRDVGLL